MNKLPSSVQILGQHITIKSMPDHGSFGDRHGDWDSQINTIRVVGMSDQTPQDVTFATYYHELTHAILDLTGHTELSQDENFVERISQAFYQAEQTRKYK